MVKHDDIMSAIYQEHEYMIDTINVIESKYNEMPRLYVLFTVKQL